MRSNRETQLSLCHKHCKCLRSNTKSLRLPIKSSPSIDKTTHKNDILREWGWNTVTDISTLDITNTIQLSNTSNTLQT